MAHSSVAVESGNLKGRWENQIASLLPTPTKGDGAWGVTGGGSVNYGMTLTDVAKQTAGFPMYREES